MIGSLIGIVWLATKLILLAAVGVLVYLLKSLKYPYLRSRTCTAPRLVHNLSEARKLLKSSILTSRAIPNQRLVTTFNIMNSFTTTSAATHRNFLSLVKDRLRSPDWKRLTTEARSTVCAAKIDRSIILPELVQRLDFRAVLAQFFDSSELACDPTDKDIRNFTTLINDLWLSSKVPPPPHSGLSPKNKALATLLHKIFNLPSLTPSNNPLNLILPAYETLWRVILRCFLEIRFRPADDISSTALKAFLASPTPDAHLLTSASGVSVKHIAYEALRLYPPTRRIHRYLPSNEAIAIDVEFLHRSPAIWGPTAEIFDPRRWSTLRGEQKEAFMPFGGKPFGCPAKQEFAPMMIGVLVGVLVEGVDGEWKLGGGADGDMKGFGDGEVLDNGRGAFEGLRIYRIHKDRGL